MSDYCEEPKIDIGVVVLEQAQAQLPGLINPETSGESSLSEFWRRNTSRMESTELANLVRALRKVTGFIGPNVGDVLWAGMSHGAGDTIVLDPEIAMGEYPVHPEKVDYLVGLVVHEALLKTEWSSLLWKGIEQASQNMGPRQKIVLQKIVRVGEDIYADYLSERTILGLYTRKTRVVFMELARRVLEPNRVTVDELIHLWWRSAWEEQVDHPRLQAYEKPLGILKSILPQLKAVSGGKGVIDRCDQRRAIYLQAMEDIKNLVTSWGITDKTLFWYTPEVEELDGEVCQETGDTTSSLSPDEALDVETTLVSPDSVNLTPLIRAIVDDPSIDIVPTSRFDFNIPAHPVLDPLQVARLKGIIQDYADRKLVLSRGLTSGKIDKRRLYRALITGKCFLDKQRLPDLGWSISLLVDASGSMGRGQNWRLVESTVGALHEAFRAPGIRIQAWAYFESTGICMISSLIKGRHLMSVPPGGQTPSGQALIATAFLASLDKRRKFLIHLTDGASNCGAPVKYGIDYCRQKNINLITLACGVQVEDIKRMQEQYGRTIQFLDHIAQLPAAVEKLLKWTLLYGASRGRPVSAA